MDIFSLICLILLIVASIGFSLYLIRTNRALLNSIKSFEATESRGTDAEELTSYELERLEREEEFDARITRLKEELAYQQELIQRSGVSADELHPLVKNLPHDTVNSYRNDPDVEYAD